MKLLDKITDLFTGDNEDEGKAIKNTPEEEKYVSLVTTNQENAESVREGLDSIIQTWEDEQKIYVGGGKQWETSFAYRSKKFRKIRPNSENNFVFLAIQSLHATVTANNPEPTIEGTGKEDDEVAKKLTYLSKFNDIRNNFKATWRKMVMQFLSYGPIIGAVLWDNDWQGGTGPDRWIGDVRMLHIDRREIFFDPAIIDLESRLQECEFITRKPRKKLSWFKEQWPERGGFVSSETNQDEQQDEGSNPKQAYLIEYWHRGKPWMMPDKAKNKLLERAAAEQDTYKAKDLADMAKGQLKGVHVAYVAAGVFLGYEPYRYDDGKYPFVYRTLYQDENSPFGFGEIRNSKIPQVMHNKADEIEIDAYSREGLGGGFYQGKAITDRQLEEIKKHSGKGGMWFNVDNINMMRDREPVKTPQSLTNYKEHKQRMIETITSNTPIQQGMSPGANVPYSTVKELGARTDVRTKQKIEILEDFLIEMNKLRLNRFQQFYTEERYYRLKGETEPIEGTFKADEMQKTWPREEAVNKETGVIETKLETYVPEFDITVKINDEKPDSREYYTSTGFELFKLNGLSMEDLWYTLDEGKFPPKDTVLDNLKAQNEAMQIAEMMKQVPPEMKDQILQAIQQMMQQGQEQGGDMDTFLDALPDDILAMVQQMQPEEQEQHVQAMMQMQPEQLEQHIQSMRGGMAG